MKQLIIYLLLLSTLQQKKWVFCNIDPVKLAVSDFKGPARERGDVMQQAVNFILRYSPSKNDSVYNIKIEMHFYPEYSSIRKQFYERTTELERQYILRHEIYHMKLGLTAAWEYGNSKNIFRPGAALHKKNIKDFENKLTDYVNIQQDKYDTLTNHSMNKENQRRYESMIDVGYSRVP